MKLTSFYIISFCDRFYKTFYFDFRTEFYIQKTRGVKYRALENLKKLPEN